MSPGLAPDSGDGPDSLDKRVDDACLRFVKVWREGSGPRIEDYLDEFTRA
jgi:hypothetical protein